RGRLASQRTARRSMIYQGRASRQAAQVARSQLAVRLGLAIYAALCAAVLLRCAVLVFGFPDSVWTVETILTVSSPIVLPLTLAPASNRVVFGSATLADLTAVLLLTAAPLLLLGWRRYG
ncbi:MAG: hypothetical protein ACRDJC_10760, partial [Thermomicrobiales bacterium]